MHLNQVSRSVLVLRIFYSTYTHLHSSTLLHKCWLDFVLEIINLLREVHLGGSRLNGKFLAKRNPFACKFCSFWQGFKGEHGSSIIRDVAWDLINRVVHRQDWKNCIGCIKWRFLHRIHSTHKHIYWAEHIWFALSLIPASMNWFYRGLRYIRHHITSSQALCHVILLTAKMRD